MEEAHNTIEVRPDSREESRDAHLRHQHTLWNFAYLRLPPKKSLTHDRVDGMYVWSDVDFGKEAGDSGAAT